MSVFVVCRLVPGELVSGLFWYLFWFKVVIGMRSSLTIVCTNCAFPFFSIFSWPSTNWVFFLWFYMRNVSKIKSLRLLEQCPFLVI